MALIFIPTFNQLLYEEKERMREDRNGKFPDIA